MARVFISYASGDFDQARDIRQWLIEADHDVFLFQGPRDGVVVGEQWRERLHERLRWADAVVCVVTSAFVASRWCTIEVEIARSRGSRILPLRAERGVVAPSLEDIQHTTAYGEDPATVRSELIEALSQVDAAGGRGWPDGQSPFPGLSPFTLEQHRVFFGRGSDTKRLVELLRSIAERGEASIVLVVGPSGCGKSSLVRAGLLPLMANEPGWWSLGVIRPGADPLSALTNEIAAASRKFGLNWTRLHIREQLEARGVSPIVEELLHAAPGGARHRLLIVVDQFEETADTSHPSRERPVR